MSKLTINVKVSFTGKFAVPKKDVIELVESACKCLKDADAPASSKMVSRQVLIAGLEDGLDGVVKFQLRHGIRKYIKDDLDEITHKSPALVTFR